MEQQAPLYLHIWPSRDIQRRSQQKYIRRMSMVQISEYITIYQPYKDCGDGVDKNKGKQQGKKTIVTHTNGGKSFTDEQWDATA